MRFAFGVALLFLVSNVMACSCVKRPTIGESSIWAKHVFVGKISAIKTIEENGFERKHISLDVVESIKGKPTGEYFIKPGLEILTNCYPRTIELGDQYVFFVKDKKETTLSYCSSTKNLEYLARAHPNWRNSIKQSPNQTSKKDANNSAF